MDIEHTEVTAREREVLVLVGARLQDEEIAARLRIARSTVAILLRSAMGKLAAQTRGEALAKLAESSDETAPRRCGEQDPSDPPSLLPG
jgi:DNA-binding CsgD family transcriptional regulator